MKEDFPRCIVLSDETPLNNVDSFGTECTLNIFYVFTLDGKEKAQPYLSRNPKT